MLQHRIGIFTRSINYELYKKSQYLIDIDAHRERIINTTGDSYFYRMFEHKKYDWSINIDEDAFVIDDNAILDLLEYMKDNGYVNCGMSDAMLVRYFNPAVVNAFFNIINIKEIRNSTKDIKTEVLKFDYKKYKDLILSRVPKRFLNLPAAKPNMGKLEDYYSLFLWIASKFKTLYLDAHILDDGISVELLNHNGKPMLVHSWFSRCYRVNDEDGIKHTPRIEALYQSACIQKGVPVKSPVLWKKLNIPDRKRQILVRKINTALHLLFK